MPELPDVTVYVERLAAKVVGQRLERISIRHPFLLRSVTPPISAVEGRAVVGVERLGKRIVLALENALFVVVHIAPSAVSTLPAILARHGELAARHPVDDEPIRPGTIYVAPPDHHLLVRPGRVRLTRGPRENGHRPAVDPLFRSAALRGCAGACDYPRAYGEVSGPARHP